jgi:hypothetical protein
MRGQSLEQRFWEKVDKNKSDTFYEGTRCWEWIAAKDQKGYGFIGIGTGVATRAHRMSWVLAHGEFPKELCVLHKCDNPSCVNPDHLFLGTNQDNIDDRERKGRNIVYRGEDHGNAKLTDEDVLEIRRKYATGEANIPKLSNEYHVSISSIGRIILRNSWTHI